MLHFCRGGAGSLEKRQVWECDDAGSSAHPVTEDTEKQARHCIPDGSEVWGMFCVFNTKVEKNISIAKFCAINVLFLS